MTDTIRQDISERMMVMLEPIATEEGVDLVCIDFVPMKKQSLVRIFIDKPGGVTIDECQKMSKRAHYVLEAENPITGSYRLEVSSPGLFYEFRNHADYVRNVGKRVHVWLKDPDTRPRDIVGALESTETDQITVLDEKEQRHTLALTAIQKTRLDPILFPNAMDKGTAKKGKQWAGK